MRIVEDVQLAQHNMIAKRVCVDIIYNNSNVINAKLSALHASMDFNVQSAITKIITA